LRWITFCLLVTAVLAAAGAAGAAAEGLTEDERGEINELTRDNLEAVQEEDMDAMLKTLHPHSPSYDDPGFAEELQAIFAQYGLPYELEIADIAKDMGEVRVEYRQFTRANDQEDLEGKEIRGVQFLLPHEGEWRIFAAEVIEVRPLDDVVSEPEEAEEHAEQPAKGLFYEVSGGENDLYLFGGLHFGREGVSLHDKVYQAFAESDVLGLELDMQSLFDAGNKLLRRGTFDGDTVMSDLVPADLFDEVVSALEIPGVGAEEIEELRPWYAANEIVTLANREANYDPAFGAESYFATLAEEEDMEIAGMETVADQLAPFTHLSQESQKIYLKDALAESRGELFIDAAFPQWQAGNADFFAAERRSALEKAETQSLQAFHEAMYDERDAAMAAQIEEWLNDDSGRTYFVVAGALHLAGENSIVDNLRDKGYRVSEVY